MKNYSDEALTRKLNEYDWDEYYKIRDPEKGWVHLYNVLINVFDELCPEKKMTNVPRKNEWITVELFELMRARDDMFRKAKKSKDPDEWSLAKTFRNKANEACLKAKNEFTIQKLKEYGGNPRKFWQHIKPLVGKAVNKQKADIELDNATNELQVPEIFNKFFTTIGTKLKNRIQPLDKKEAKILKCSKLTSDRKQHTFRFRKIIDLELIEIF